jgi:ADP-ribose pyrophosphatase
MKGLNHELSHQVDQPFSGRVFNVEVHAVTLPDGTSSRREIVRHNGGACVLALDSQMGVAMVRQYRKAFDCELLEIPAGKLEAGEDPLDCARRELSEETGLTAARFHLLTTFYPSPGYSSEILHIYLATGLTPGQAHLDHGEFLSCQTCPLDELLDRVDRGEIRDAKTIIALTLTARRLNSDPGLIRETEERP